MDETEEARIRADQQDRDANELRDIIGHGWPRWEDNWRGVIGGVREIYRRAVAYDKGTLRQVPSATRVAKEDN